MWGRREGVARNSSHLKTITRHAEPEAKRGELIWQRDTRGARSEARRTDFLGKTGQP